MKRSAALLVLLLSFGWGACAVSRLAGPQQRGAPKAGGKLYVTSWFGGGISVVDLATRRVITTIAVGVQDHNVFLTPDQREAWVTNNNDGTVSVIDTATDQVIRTIPVGVGPRHTFFSPDGREAYVTTEFDNTVVVIDHSSDRPVAKIKVGMMPHFAIVVGDRLFVTNFGGADVSVIQRSTRELVTTIPVGFGPLGAGATRDGKRVYVACHNSNEVTVIDAEALRVVERIPTEAGPVQVTVTPEQRHAYVAEDGRGTVQKIDVATNRIVKTIHLGASAGSHGLAFAGGGRLLAVTNTGAGSVSLIDTVDDEVVGTVKVLPAPEGITFKRL